MSEPNFSRRFLARPSPGRIGIIVLACVAIAAVLYTRDTSSGPVHVSTAGSPSAAPAPNDSFNGVSQSALQKCIAAGTSNCQDQVPGLRACMEARKQCNQSADDPNFAKTQAGAGAGQPTTMSEDEARGRAVSAAKNPADPSNRAATRMMTVGDLQRDGQLQNSDLNPELKVWVVTVHAPRQMFGSVVQPGNDKPGQGPREANMYTVIFNAVTKAPIDSCIGEGCYSVG